MLIALLAACIIGIGSQYAPGVMESTIRVRQDGLTAHNLPNPMPPAAGSVAVPDCSWIGDQLTVWLYGQYEIFNVVDCAGDSATRQWMTRNRVVLEFDFLTADRHQFVGYGAKPIYICERRQMKRSTFVLPDGKTVLVKGEIAPHKYLIRDSAREYLTSGGRPPGLLALPRIASVAANGDIEVSTDESILNDKWTKTTPVKEEQ